MVYTVPEPVISRAPNQSSYYPGENVTLTCVVEDVHQDENIVYRWSFTPSINQSAKPISAASNLSLVPHETDAGNYTCYANTSSKFTMESQGVTTTLTVLCKHKCIFCFPMLCLLK